MASLEPESTGADLTPGSYKVCLELGPIEVSLKPGIKGWPSTRNH